MGAIEIIALVAICVLFVFALVVLLDKGFFKRKIEKVELGMTGEEIQNEHNIKFRNITVSENGYTAKVSSFTRLFKYEFIFEEGKLIGKLPYYKK